MSGVRRREAGGGATPPDEYQDGHTAGSLVRARRCWLDLMDAGVLPFPQRFTFAFGCPTLRMAGGLADFLRYADFGGFVRTTGDAVVVAPPWGVVGTTAPSVWSLASLEHLFMDLRRAGARYDSTLATLDLVPVADGGAGRSPAPGSAPTEAP